MGKLLNEFIESARNRPLQPLLPHMIENKKLGGYGEALNLASMLGYLEEACGRLVNLRKRRASKGAIDYAVADVEHAYRTIKY